ncbi:MAG: hypothetical protein COY66_04070 [Candidatus Kerfeldbacteria bacterium CG_4_10_14_0_8_um_filter_42_10]|uniref:YtkA-like domain-containing protein n=1 Tax=Candidatus Kerfeldbacteria bacterium CG_4_10_14_0_8_um_filter_42_10 TaxID=2014248 RepID=A0A2M7RI79_9BACT|nr:MAG: hypothetical protein COY66_04070 [Candidatus Kerfeldbacteria bacterium CG_4_10_14_0_8_um_filter_42_10]
MKINNKALLITVAAIVVILVGWSWLNQSHYFNGNSEEAVKGINAEAEANVNEQTQDPMVAIVFPGNQTVLNPGPLMVKYSLSGDLTAVDRVDLRVLRGSDIILQRTSFFSQQEKMGSVMIPNLEAGEYHLLVRLVKKDGTFYNSGFSQASALFRVNSI